MYQNLKNPEPNPHSCLLAARFSLYVNITGLYKWSAGPDLPIPMKVGCITALDAAETEHLLLAERAEDGSILAASWTYNWNDVIQVGTRSLALKMSRISKKISRK